MLRKDRLDYRLVNLAIIVFIFYLMYQTGNLWIDSVNKIIHVLAPFVIAFAAAYATHPIAEKLQSKGLPKWLSILILIMVLFILIGFIIYLITSTLVGQLSDLFSRLSTFIAEMTDNDFSINLSEFQVLANDTFKTIITNITTYVSDGAINLIGSSISFVGKVLIGIAAYVYFLIDMDKIRLIVKEHFKRKSSKTYNYVKLLDEQMKNYLSGLVQVMIISMFEYGIAYSIIGHPNALLLGFLAGMLTLVPYFGGIACNCVAAVTAFVVSPGLFVRTLITFFILSSLDSYVINPAVYGKSNSIHPLLTIFALFAGSAIFGIIGVFISFPLTIIIYNTYKYYESEISGSIKRNKNREEKA